MNCRTAHAFAHQDVADEPEAKRRRTDDVFRPSITVPIRTEALSFGDEIPAEQHDTWKRIFQEANRMAPRVGNRSIEYQDITFISLGEIVPDIDWTHMYVCRGTERFQVPTGAPSGKEASVRQTWCVHRHKLQMLDMGRDDWSNLTRSQRIRACVPSRLTITTFGNPKSQSSDRADHLPERSEPVSDSQTIPASPAKPAEPAPSSGAGELAAPPTGDPSDSSVAIRTKHDPTIAEGWAPPPTPIHGPAFRRLSDTQKQELVKLHKNLGHPDPNKLGAHLVAQKADPAIIEAALEYSCDACLESIQVRHQRPGKLHEPTDFNEVVGIDGIFWKGKAGFQVYIIHCVDECSTFQMARRTNSRQTEATINLFQELWMSWAGTPGQIYADPAGEFTSQTWMDFLQSHGISSFTSSEAWQKGRVERHGQVLKQMLHRVDQDRTIQDLADFDRTLIACCRQEPNGTT